MSRQHDALFELTQLAVFGCVAVLLPGNRSIAQ
jgi:hypothetical protein